jgi:hypothetical protein
LGGKINRFAVIYNKGAATNEIKKPIGITTNFPVDRGQKVNRKVENKINVLSSSVQNQIGNLVYQKKSQINVSKIVAQG